MTNHVMIKIFWQSMSGLLRTHVPQSSFLISAVRRTPADKLHMFSNGFASRYSTATSNQDEAFPRKKKKKYFVRKPPALDVDGVPTKQPGLGDVTLDYEGSKTIINITDPMHRQRLLELTSLFPKKDVKHLAEKSPQVFVQPFRDIHDIFRYIADYMGMDQNEMVKAGVFDYPFEHIVRRHTCAVKCGVFQKVHVKRPELAALNPTLTSMIRTSDVNFSRVMGITEEEYRVFRDMFEEVEEKTMNELKESLAYGYSPRDKKNDVDEDDRQSDTDGDPKEDGVFCL